MIPHITDPDSTADSVVYTGHSWTDADIDAADDAYVMWGVVVLGLIVGLVFGPIALVRYAVAVVAGWLAAAGWEWAASPRI